MMFKNKFFLIALFLFLFSLSAISAFNLIKLRQSQVLGIISSTGVPCTVINNWQKNYCSTVPVTPPVYITPTRTSTVMPTRFSTAYPTRILR